MALPMPLFAWNIPGEWKEYTEEMEHVDVISCNISRCILLFIQTFVVTFDRWPQIDQTEDLPQLWYPGAMLVGAPESPPRRN